MEKDEIKQYADDTNVPLKRNRQTTLSGRMYSSGASIGSFQLNTDWLTGNSITF